MVEVVDRAGWGARSPRRVTPKKMRKKSTGHYNGPKIATLPHNRCPAQMRAIQNYHMDSNGWNDIAYNFVICQHGSIFVGRGYDTANGANGTNEANFDSHAVMWMDGDGNDFTEPEKIGFKACVKLIADKTGAPNAAVGHKDHKPTACPGPERYNWIKAGMPVSGSSSTPSHPPVNTPAVLPTLKRGSSGAYVTIAQAIISDKAGGGIIVDGKFGSNTEKRVKDLQRVFKLSQDGIIGPKTWDALKFLLKF